MNRGSSNGVNGLSAYQIDPNTGALSAIIGSPFTTGANPFSVAVDRAGKFAYVVNSGSSDGVNGLSAYQIDPNTGALSAIIASESTTGNNPRSVAVSPNGKFAYVANFASTTGVNGLSAYTINQTTGALSAIIVSESTTGSQPQSVAVDPNGKFAYVANYGSTIGVNGLSAYTINPNTGALSAIIGSESTTGSRPISVAVSPNGQFAYVANFASTTGVNGLFAYTINQTTGALSAIIVSESTTGSQPRSVTVDPNGKFVYVVNSGSTTGVNGLSAYTINTNTGALTALSGSASTTGDGPISVRVDPTGKFAYVANFDSDGLSAYTINPNTGALSALSGPPFTAGDGPNSIITVRILQ